MSPKYFERLHDSKVLAFQFSRPWLLVHSQFAHRAAHGLTMVFRIRNSSDVADWIIYLSKIVTFAKRICQMSICTQSF